MWFYTADTAMRIAHERHHRHGPRSASPADRHHRMATVLRSLADRIDTPRSTTSVHAAPWG